MRTDFLNLCNTEISRRYPASPHYSFLHLAGTVVMGEDPGLLAKILGFQSRLCWKWVSAKKRAMIFDYLLSLKDLENQSARTNGKRRGGECIKGWWNQTTHRECKLLTTSHKRCLVLGERASSFPSPLLSSFPRPHFFLLSRSSFFSSSLPSFITQSK